MSVTLSASKVKTLQCCSWSYYCQYVLKMPEEQNTGAARGSVCHEVLELLLKDKRKSKVTRALADSDISTDVALNKFLFRKLKEHEVSEQSDIDLVKAMIVTGLKNDFYCDGCTKILPEYKFKITNEKPRYTISGIIDKAAFFSDFVRISDYKTSKAKFVGEELKINVQAMFYSLAVRHLFKMPSKVRFLFLKFPKKPIQDVEYTDEQLSGFEYYLEYLNDYLDKFTIDHAKSDFAANSMKKSWLCGSTIEGKWTCPFRNPVKYYSLVDKNGEVVAGSFKNDFKVIKEGSHVEEKDYKGCPCQLQKSENQGSSVFI